MSAQACILMGAALAHLGLALAVVRLNAAERRRKPARLDPHRLRGDRANWTRR